MSRITTVLIADDHPLLRSGLRQTIERHAELRVVAEVGDGHAALEQIVALKPDVAIVDLDMPGLDGFGVLRAIRSRQLATATIVLTFHASEQLLLEAMDLGAAGYILKDSALIAIVEGIAAVVAGRRYVSATLTPLLVNRRTRTQELEARQPGLNDLTPTERRILRLIAAGQASKEIAEALSIHFRTVENHRVNIGHKLGLHGHNAVLKFALEHKSEV